MDEEETVYMQYLMADGTDAYDERSADQVRIWNYDDLVVTLSRYQDSGRWVEGELDEVGPAAALWRDADTWLERNPIDGQVS